jgi:hypothetical protein
MSRTARLRRKDPEFVELWESHMIARANQLEHRRIGPFPAPASVLAARHEGHVGAQIRPGDRTSEVSADERAELT